MALTANVYRPAHDGIVPTVVQIHGGAWRSGDPGENADLAQALAASGFGVFSIDYRLAPAWTWPSQLEDVLDARRWVSEHRSPPTPDPIDTRFVLTQFLAGSPEQRPDAYADASPITRANRPHPPVLIITANRDHIVEPRFGPMLHQKLLESGTSFFVNMPWADHAFDSRPLWPQQSDCAVLHAAVSGSHVAIGTARLKPRPTYDGETGRRAWL